jgi:hypothetical protein
MNAPRVSTYCKVGALAMASLGVTSFALAQEESPHSLTANIAATSNYFYRGISQTNNGPALQLGVDYVYKPLNLYAGVWASNVDGSKARGYYYVDQDGQQVVVSPGTPDSQYQMTRAPGYDGSSVEVDLKLGWIPKFDKLGIDIGYQRYWYPGTRFQPNNFNEYHAGLSYDLWGYATPKFTSYYSDNFYGLGASWYHDLTVTVPLPYEFTLTGHYGWTRYNNSVNYGGGYSYNDYSVGLSRELYKGISLAVAWVDRDKTYLCAPPFQCGSSAVATLSYAF